jgi:hypothetical protein
MARRSRTAIPKPGAIETFWLAQELQVSIYEMMLIQTERVNLAIERMHSEIEMLAKAVENSCNSEEYRAQSLKLDKLRKDYQFGLSVQLDWKRNEPKVSAIIEVVKKQITNRNGEK